MSIACGAWRNVHTPGSRSNRQRWPGRAPASLPSMRLPSIALMPDAEGSEPSARRSLAAGALLALIAQIPFELRYKAFGLSNLQWTFVAVALLSAPDLLSNWKKLATDRLVEAATLFAAIQWMAASYAPEFHTNALKAAVRFTAGLVLLAIAK